MVSVLRIDHQMQMGYREWTEDCVVWIANRGRLLNAGAAALAAAVVPLPSSAASVLGPHKHGQNGVTLPLDKSVNMTTHVLDGPDWSLAHVLGDVVFINFFATWCPPCVGETPVFVDYAAHAPAGVSVVSMDVLDNDDNVRAWRKRFGVTYPIAMDRHGIFAANINMRAYPTTLIFRPDGRLSCAFVGTMSDETLESERLYALDTSRP